MYQRPTITVLGSVRGLTLDILPQCKWSGDADGAMPQTPDNQEPKPPGIPPGPGDDVCFVS
jgi:hypothetical protein